MTQIKADTVEATGPVSRQESSRRPVAARSTSWARALASFLNRAGVRPNQISVASIVFSLAGAGIFLLTSHLDSSPRRALAFALVAACIGLRLLCNMLDGMVAVEFGRATKSGMAYNELPDRLADVLFLASAGYAASNESILPVLGWSAAVLALLTAHVRALGATAGAAQDFSGPLAKPQRMWLLAAGCVATALEVLLHGQTTVLSITLALIAGGTALTLFMRTRRLLRFLEEESGSAS